MAVQTHIHPAAARFTQLPGAGDRVKAFRSAKLHSAMVRMLRWLLPLAAACVAGLYFLPSRITFEVDGGEGSADTIDISEGAFKMVNPRFKGIHKKHGVYDVHAEYATQAIQDPNVVTLNVISAELVSKKGEKTTFEAPSGIFDSKKEELTFDNGVAIGGNAGFSGQLKTATAFFKASKLISDDPVDLSFRSSRIKAQSMTFFSSEGRAIFKGGVKVHLERQAEGSPK